MTPSTPTEQTRTTGLLTRCWPFLAVLVLALAIASPARLPGTVFCNSFQGDTATTAWFYSFVGRSILLDGGLPERLDDFGYPDPLPLEDPFATIVDAVILAPTEAWPGWPDRWGWAITMAVCLNALGAALLARSFGGGTFAVLVAGLLGAGLAPAWQEILEGRANTMAPGLAAMALALFMRLLPSAPEAHYPAPPPSSGAKRGRLVALALVSGCSGAMAATIYPPFLLMLLPLALLLVLGALPGSRARQWWPAVMALALGAALSGSELHRIWLHPMSHFAAPSGNTCPPSHGLVALRDLAVISVGQFGIDFAYLPLSCWLLAVLALLRPQKKMIILLAILLALLLALLSTGPCLLLDRASGTTILHAGSLPRFFGRIHQGLARLHDLDRLASMAGLLLASLAGLGAESLPLLVAGRFGPLLKTRPRSLLSLAACTPALGIVAQQSISTRTVIADGDHQQPWQVPRSAQFLAQAAPGPAAELPWDQSQQFLSAISEHRPRVNPLRLGDFPKTENAFIQWLDALGRGALDQARELPDAESVESSGLCWVLHDSLRCQGTRIPAAACGYAVIDSLADVLGSPMDLGDGLLVWGVGSCREEP